MKCLCLLQMCADKGVKVVTSIISRAVVVNVILNFMSALVEESDIFGIFLKGQLMTVRVLQRNVSN